ncbi:MAG: HPP family protein [Candidatus Aureabacteria bacterium]|nr:HPP family protein [Candidatus Auribacterota bacterium]
MQSLLAAFVIFIMFLFLNMNRSLIVVSIGATAFIVFAMPDNVTAHPKNVIGGHLIGFIVGFLLSLIPYYSFLFSVLVYSFAIGFSIFFMVVLNMEHPPASATALGVAMNGFSWKVSLVFFISIIVLIIVQRYFKQHLHCLVYSQKK